MARPSPPLVLLPACNRVAADGYAFHLAGAAYVEAVRLAGCLPLIVPTPAVEEIDALLDIGHGVLLTGSPSNVHPSHFGEAVEDPSLPLDTARDGWVLPLVPRALARGVPLLAICRGAQEFNVALGGSLHQTVHAVGPYDDHRSRDEDPLATQWGPRHPVTVEPGGRLATLTGLQAFEVNSLHGQAVNGLAPGLHVEARAHDGLIEAFCQPDTSAFNLGVQWHPEWDAAQNPVSMALLRAFGEACALRRDRRI